MTTPRVALSKLARAALRYAEHGWHVFPIKPRLKEPIVAKGFLTATNNVEQVAAWWSAHPNANIGLWPGQSGLVIVDLDSKSAETIARNFGLFSEPTLECRTGREGGGRHLYFKRPLFHVSNAKPFTACDELEVRGDAGYVVLPPSIHPSGRVYQWLGRVEEIRELPASFLVELEAAQSRQTSSDAARGAAREIALEESIGEGGRNNTLTRYAGRLLAKGIDEEETLSLLAAMNVARCKPPLPFDEVNAIVASIARKESTKPRAQSAIRLVTDDEAPDPAPAIPAPRDLAATQLEAARNILTRDLTLAPRWAWPELDTLAGPMLPGDLVVVGALTGNGKSTLLMSQMDAFASKRVPTLYLPLEVDPAICRLRWAAWKLQLTVTHVLRQDWSRLPEGSKEALDGVLEEQASNPFMHFATPKRVTYAALNEWCRWAVDQAGCRVVMIDHFHRLDAGDPANFRVAITELARRVKDLARELGVAILAAAQLNRGADPVDAYIPPRLERLKEAGGIGEEADAVLMLSRKLRRDLPQHWANDLRLGKLTERDICEPTAMTITCRKHRIDADALNRNVGLQVENGRLQSRRWPWEQQDRWEAE